jgi:deazaflavin-dependent oxidoreductase (nitroreductase family)
MAGPQNPTVIKLMSTTHRLWYRMTRGAVGGRLRGAPILLLTTTGAKSGKQRTMPLMYLADGDNLVVVASNAGHDRHPGWWLNLRRDPRATVQIRGKRMSVRAQQAEADVKARLWPRLVEMYGDYAAYQRLTAREIPVVILRRDHAASGAGR